MDVTLDVHFQGTTLYTHQRLTAGFPCALLDCGFFPRGGVQNSLYARFDYAGWVGGGWGWVNCESDSLPPYMHGWGENLQFDSSRILHALLKKSYKTGGCLLKSSDQDHRIRVGGGGVGGLNSGLNFSIISSEPHPLGKIHNPAPARLLRYGALLAAPAQATAS